MTTRRKVIQFSTVLSSAALLAACAGTTTNTVVHKVVTDVQNLPNYVNIISSEFTALVSAISILPSVGTNATVQANVAKAKNLLATVQADAATIANATTVPNGSVVVEFTNGVKAIADIALALLPGASPYVTLADAAVSLIPEILALAHVTGAGPVVHPKYTRNQAYALLKAGV